MRYNDDSFARLVGGAVKLASPEAGIDTCGDSGHITLGNGQVFRFTVQEVDPDAAARSVTCPQCERTSYNPNDVPASYG